MGMTHLVRARVVLTTLSATLVVAVVVRGQTPATPSGASQTPPTGAISGTVKDAVSGRPLAGAVVSLRAATTAQLARIIRQVTDERGRYVFRDLRAGDGYSLSAAKLGYVDGEFGQTSMAGTAGKIPLKDAQWFADADVLLWRPGAISGRVLDEDNEPMVGVYVRAIARAIVAGRQTLLGGAVAITDDRGEYRLANLLPGSYLVQVPSVQTSVPADAAPSTLYGASPGAGPSPLLLNQPTPPRVDAALDQTSETRLIIGNYATPPVPDAGRNRAYPITFFPGVASPGLAAAIELGLSEEKRGVDVMVRPVATVRIAGRVAAPAEAWSGLVLRLLAIGLEDLAGGGEAATALVRSDGSFAFLNVPAGAYVIDCTRFPLELTYQANASSTSLPGTPGLRANGFQSSNLTSGPPGTGYVRRSGTGEDLYWTHTLVTVDASDITNLTVPLTRALALSGRMVYEGTTRTVVEATGGASGGGRVGVAPPTQVAQTVTTPRPDRTPTVYAEPANGSPSLGLPRSDFPREDDPPDTFRIDGLKGGEYVLRVPSGLERFSIKSITIGGADYTTKPFDAALDARGEVVITLTDRIITLQGGVRNEQGPVASAAVIAFPTERAQWTRQGFTPLRIRSTPVAGKDGYLLRGLPAGEYFVVAVEASLVTAWQDPKFLERVAPLATRVSLAWEDVKSVDLRLVRVP